MDSSKPCENACSNAVSVEDLNRDCFCLSVDPALVHAQLEVVLAAHGVPQSLAATHANLFSALPVYVSRRHIDKTARMVTALEEAIATPAYQLAALSWAPAIARFDPGSPGGLLGLDFHLGPNGPRLIEVNTNPGGVLLNALVGETQRECMPELTISPTDAGAVEEAVLATALTEWRLQRGSAPLQFVAIVDESPVQQYLYPEFLLFLELFRRQGYGVAICDPRELVRRDNRLWLGDCVVDFVYNRLTDFAFLQPAHEAISAAYRNGEVVISPHPRAHALYADKRNLSLLCQRDFLDGLGIGQQSVESLMEAIPPTQVVTPLNRDALWASRRHLFFKPAAGFGSKASYRGDKLTRRVWDEMASGNYVAQEVVPPSERHLNSSDGPLKVDIRCYAYAGKVLSYAARMYQGQTTNFRTPGGGFAPVLTSRQEIRRPLEPILPLRQPE